MDNLAHLHSETASPVADLTEAQRLLDNDFTLVRLHDFTKRPIGDDWNKKAADHIAPDATGYGLPLARNRLCSIDPDHVDMARAGLAAWGYDLDDLLSAGVRTRSTRPGSGGRSAFAEDHEEMCRWLSFRVFDDEGKSTTVLELRAKSANLQDCVPGVVYADANGGMCTQQYANGRTFDEAPELPDEFARLWRQLSTDDESLREYERKFYEGIISAGFTVNGKKPVLLPSMGSGEKLPFEAKGTRGEFNRQYTPADIIDRHGYRYHANIDRWSHPGATGAPGIRPIPGKDGLWRSDHAGDPLHGTFDAWAAYVQLDHKGDVEAAVAAYTAERQAAIPEGSWLDASGGDDAPVTYDSLMDKVAELNNATSPKQITALAEATASLDQVAAGMVLRAIKDATGLNMGDLKPVAAAARRKKRPPSVTTNGVKRMMPQMFPDVVLDANGEPEKVLQTIPNIAKLLEFYGIHASYNVIKKKTRLVVPNASGSPDNADNSALTSVISLAKLNEIPTEQVPAYVEQIADENQCNPVADWITEKPWDGQDRLQALYETLTLSVEYPPEMRDLLIRRWLISAVAAVLMPRGFHCRGVLVLQGRQSLGKTRWLQQLVGDPQLKEDVVLVDHNLDPANKDSVTEAITHWLVELGELEGTFRKADIARLKGFITSNMDKVRRPYARLTSEYQRRTVFFASVNDPQFLVDDTGNTRFWTISVDAIDYKHDIDTQQLWAQVAELYRQGEQWWLTSEEETKLEEINQGHRTASSIREMIHTRLDWDCNAPAWVYKTASEVLVAIGYDKPTNTQAKEAGAVLKEAKCETRRSKGYTKFLVPPSTSTTANFGGNPAH